MSAKTESKLGKNVSNAVHSFEESIGWVGNVCLALLWGMLFATGLILFWAILTEIVVNIWKPALAADPLTTGLIIGAGFMGLFFFAQRKRGGFW